MKSPVFILIIFLSVITVRLVRGQVKPDQGELTAEQISALENAAENNEATDNDQFLQQLEDYLKHPLNLNKATEEDLSELLALSPLQIQSFLQYRKKLGPLISIYELQAVPDWDLKTILSILPYVKVGASAQNLESIKSYLKTGDQQLLLRYGRTFEKSSGYIRRDTLEDNPLSNYAGSPDKLLLRYKFSYPRHLKFGFTAQKDAGEQFFNKTEKSGFDFYSAHFAIKNYHAIKCLALGDYTVNMGQGLINWQGFAFNRTSAVMNIKREGDIIEPYSSAGEVYYYRGAGLTINKGKWDYTAFFSYKPIDGNLGSTDSSGGKVASSLPVSGYHRTQTEIAEKHAVHLTTYGGNISYSAALWHLGLNVIHHRLSHPYRPNYRPYRIFEWQGNHLTNASLDYSATYHNLYFFGETAISDNRALATINSVLMSVDPKVDIGLLYRHYAKNYQALYPNAFGAGSSPQNENGFYASTVIRFNKQLHLNAYADIFSFPRLKYRVNAPSAGAVYFAKLNWQRADDWQLYFQYRSKNKDLNSASPAAIEYPLKVKQQNFRLNVDKNLGEAISLRARGELVTFKKQAGDTESGWLVYSDCFYHPVDKEFSLSGRLAYFNTDSYNSRIYTYENDVLYRFYVPFYYQQGLHYYINAHYHFARSFSFWLRLAQTNYFHKTTISSGLSKIYGHLKTSLNTELIYKF